jgi:multidrug efflux system membrane fusion protein
LLIRCQCLSFSSSRRLSEQGSFVPCKCPIPVPRRWLFGLLILLLVALLAWWLACSARHKEAAAVAGRAKAWAWAGARASAVERPGAGARGAGAVGDFPLYYKALGTVTATNTINVRSRVAGELVKIHFEEGQMVKAGDLLAEIDPRPYRTPCSRPKAPWRRTRRS